MNMVHVFIVGSKGIPAHYGGFETFADRLVTNKTNDRIKYHVSCMNNDCKEFSYNNAECFSVSLPIPGAIGRIIHMHFVMKYIEKWIKQNNSNEKVIVYILGCRIGPFIIPHRERLHKLGAVIMCNPDGLEWKRDKWNDLEKRFLKICERFLVTSSDMVICDSKCIEKYMKREYGTGIKTKFIPYGADVRRAKCCDDIFAKWKKQHNISHEGYYLIVGRFVPENNYQIILQEFIATDTNKDLIIITNVEKNRYYTELKRSGFEDDKRIKFVGTVYDIELIKNIREEAYGYIHGHEVGGTNPSLLEAMASTKINLLFDVEFNREVGHDATLYWNKNRGNLSQLISDCDNLQKERIEELSRMSKKRISNSYSWNKICKEYEEIFIKYET